MNTTFNKYQFIEDLQADIIREIEKGNIEDMEDVYEYMDTDVENACIYYSNCWDICAELNATHFDVYEHECRNISELAYACLHEYTSEELDFDKFEELFTTINA